MYDIRVFTKYIEAYLKLRNGVDELKLKVGNLILDPVLLNKAGEQICPGKIPHPIPD
jgi:hypothetical protein